jgi:Fur family peroxide stress response transcriptional regulator
VLKEIDEVLELGFSGDSNRYDGHRPYPHPHLICLECRDTMDPDVEALDALTRQIVDRAGYRLVTHRFDIYGICPACQLKQLQE